MVDLNKRLDASGASRPILTIPIADGANVQVGHRAYTDGQQLIELTDDTFLNDLILNDDPNGKFVGLGMAWGVLPNGNFIYIYAYSPYADQTSLYLHFTIVGPDGVVISSKRANGTTSSNSLINWFSAGARLCFSSPDGVQLVFCNTRQNQVQRLFHVTINYNVDGTIANGYMNTGPDDYDYFRQFMVRDPSSLNYYWTTTNDDDYLHKVNQGSNNTQGAKYQYAYSGNGTATNYVYNRTMSADYDTLVGGVVPIYSSTHQEFVMLDLTLNGSYGEHFIDKGDLTLQAVGIYWFNIDSNRKGVLHKARTVADPAYRWRIGEVHWDNDTRTSTYIDHGPIVLNNTISGQLYELDPTPASMVMDFFYDNTTNILHFAFADTGYAGNVNDTKRGILSAAFIPGTSLGEFTGAVEILYESDALGSRNLAPIVSARLSIIGMAAGHNRVYSAISVTKKIGNRQNPPSYVGIVTEVSEGIAKVKLKSGGGISEYFNSDEEPELDSEWLKIDGVWFQKSSTTESYAIAGGIEGNRFTDTSYSDDSLPTSIGNIPANLIGRWLKFEAKLDIQGLGNHHLRMTLPLDGTYGTVRRGLIGCSDGIVSGGEGGYLYNTAPSGPTLDLYVNSFSSVLFGAVYRSTTSAIQIPVSYDVEIK